MFIEYKDFNQKGFKEHLYMNWSIDVSSFHNMIAPIFYISLSIQRYIYCRLF